MLGDCNGEGTVTLIAGVHSPAPNLISGAPAPRAVNASIRDTRLGQTGCVPSTTLA